MAKTTIMTPEEAAEAEARLAQYRTAQDEAARADKRALLQPLVDVGLGTGQITGTTQQVLEAMRNTAIPIAALDHSLSNLFMSTANVLQTLDDRVRTLWEQASPAQLPE